MQSQLETAALEDLIQIESDLERKAIGLSTEFERDFSDTIAFLLELPEAGRALPRHNVRRFNLNRFPYYIIYKPERDNLVIYAIVHHRRDSGFWEDRFSA